MNIRSRWTHDFKPPTSRYCPEKHVVGLGFGRFRFGFPQSWVNGDDEWIRPKHKTIINYQICGRPHLYQFVSLKSNTSCPPTPPSGVNALHSPSVHTGWSRNLGGGGNGKKRKDVMWINVVKTNAIPLPFGDGLDIWTCLDHPFLVCHWVWLQHWV